MTTPQSRGYASGGVRERTLEHAYEPHDAIYISRTPSSEPSDRPKSIADETVCFTIRLEDAKPVVKAERPVIQYHWFEAD